MVKICPFSAQKECNDTCPLYISPKELNEFVLARLSSIGIIERTNGECSLKMLALAQGRSIFENTNTRG